MVMLHVWQSKEYGRPTTYYADLLINNLNKMNNCTVELETSVYAEYCVWIYVTILFWSEMEGYI